MESENLPKLTQQQQNFLLRYFSNGKIASEAYRYAYNCEGMKDNSVWSEASKLLKNPKVAPWVEYYESNQKKTITDELNYTAKDCFAELKKLQKLAIKSKDRNGNPNINSAIKAVELKGKIAGVFKEDNEQAKNEQTTINIVRPA